MKTYIVLDGEGGYSEFDNITECRNFISEIGRPFSKIYKQMSLEDERQNINAMLSVSCEPLFSSLFKKKGN